MDGRVLGMAFQLLDELGFHPFNLLLFSSSASSHIQPSDGGMSFQLLGGLNVTSHSTMKGTTSQQQEKVKIIDGLMMTSSVNSVALDSTIWKDEILE
ncbi:hypothetical protein PIB30_077238 [Stylosanthes scabra]|uniref:Uncharacterized protein n=1 Tax=Stylosanthes scabra TaxID=79078 RepID=A0ABU6ZPC8_9FABA|nr:hypothetical protein [Stylosanthes scabra]